MYKKLMSYIKKFWCKFVNREIITYTLAGIMTTIVNFITYYILCNILGIENLIANTIAWVAAVSFAYIVNDLWVFQSERESLGMFLFVNLLKCNNLIVKASLAFIVIILNYLFSKVYIFKNQKDRCME